MHVELVAAGIAGVLHDSFEWMLQDVGSAKKFHPLVSTWMQFKWAIRAVEVGHNL